MSDPLLETAISALRVLTRGPKGDRPDYVGHISCANATAIIGFIDAVKPFYDTHAIGAEEIRFIRQIRGLPPEALRELLDFEEFLATKYRAGAHP